MHLTSLCVRLQLHETHSPRQKRKRVDAILAKLRTHFNASFIDLTRSDQPTELILGAATVAKTRREAHDLVGHIVDALTALPDSSILDAPLITDH